MEIHRNVAGSLTAITIPVNVTYTSGDNNDVLIAALTAAVESYLSSNYSAQNGTHYDFVVEIIGSGTNRTLNLIWWAKHVSTSTWFGAQAPSDLLHIKDPSDNPLTQASSKNEVQKVVTSQQKAISYSDCGTKFQVRFGTNTNKFLDDSASNFDTMVAYATVAIDSTIETTDNDSCNKHTLTAAFTCTGTASYLWKEESEILGEGNTITLSGAGRIITLYATCNGCTFEKTITLS
jgi:hypothetical protein